MNKFLILLLVVFFNCSSGKLTVIADLPSSLKETSAIEKVTNSNLLWTIEDSGNKNNIYGLDLKGNIIKDIDISNSSNIDWEDLTSDKEGNLYIGDFGNNSKNRDDYTIYKISDLRRDQANAERINFILPKKVKPKDFEAFFIWNGNFYLFSKENKSSMLFKVPNKVGLHTAKLLKKFNLEGKNHRITSADISDNGKTIVLLNHNKLWKINSFNGDNFFEGDIQELKFEHNSQKEGICFKDAYSVYITDEKSKSGGGNLYEFSFN
ncbi:hypothetical protein [Hyunsoonleella aestuarii]|uniref:T9SS C-terminal target domain-containing protein n=1 Tax=Hyunsoonleella aestuarii TaxID=912802 RepID=A0ABP8E7V1_9FLAO|nr:hypothetical protein [Hyunsoonleella aestuarii]